MHETPTKNNKPSLTVTVGPVLRPAIRRRYVLLQPIMLSRRVNIKPIQIITGEPAGRNHPRWPRDCSWQTLKLPGTDRNSASQLDRSPSRRAKWAVRRPQDHAALFTTAPHRTSSRPEIRPQTCPRQPEHCHRG